MEDEMSRKKKFSIFISHASDDKALADRVQRLAEASIGKVPGERLVFRSSDVREIEGGADWYEAIIDALRNSRVCLSILTPRSISKPWVLYEYGGAYAIYRNAAKRLICACACGVTPNLIPAPFQRLQARCLYKREQLEQLMRELASLLKTKYSPRPRQLARLVNVAEDPVGGWDSIQLASLAVRSKSSPFRYDRLLRLARDRVFLAGPNLYTVASSDEMLGATLAFLRAKAGRKVEILLCDISNKKSVAAWSEVNPERPEAGYTYYDHLKSATKRFMDLVTTARSKRIHGLSVKVCALIPFGVAVIDPDQDSGLMAIQLIVNHGPTSQERPQFILRKGDNPEAFEYYWVSLETQYQFSRPIGKTGRQ